MIVTVTPNPAWDITLDSPGVTRGATNVVAPAARRAGGKGINVARVLASRGIPVLAVASVGELDTTAFAAVSGSLAAKSARSPAAARTSPKLPKASAAWSRTSGFGSCKRPNSASCAP